MTAPENEVEEIVCIHCDQIIEVLKSENDKLLGCPHCYMELGVADEEDNPPEEALKRTLIKSVLFMILLPFGILVVTFILFLVIAFFDLDLLLE